MWDAAERGCDLFVLAPTGYESQRGRAMAEKNGTPGRGGPPGRHWPPGRLARRHPVISAAAFAGLGLAIFVLEAYS